MLRALPPAGDAIQLGTAAGNGLRDLFPSRSTYFFGSATQGLAALLRSLAKRSGIAEPEVYIPAYTCPDLVSAAIYARVRPVLIDTQPRSPRMDIGDLERKFTARGVAIVGVNFLGIPENTAALLAFARRYTATLIEDSAQSFPASDRCDADHLVLSFGRGKPVCLLGGGAVLSRHPVDDLALLDRAAINGPQARLRFVCMAALYNLMRRPELYQLVMRIPWLRLGETRLKRLEAVAPLDDARLAALPGNARLHLGRSNAAQDRLAAALATIDSDVILDLPRTLCGTPVPRLLRYPVLVRNPELRAALFTRLAANGLGVSQMYKRPLMDIDGVAAALLTRYELPNATRFAQELLTLPVHSGVRGCDIDSAIEIMRTLA